MNAPDHDLSVQVACGLPDRQRVVDLRVPAGTTAREAVLQSGLAAEFPEVDLPRCPLAIFARPVPDDQVLKAWDRVEILRPLVQDPREARRQVAARGGVMGAPKPGPRN